MYVRNKSGTSFLTNKCLVNVVLRPEHSIVLSIANASELLPPVAPTLASLAPVDNSSNEAGKISQAATGGQAANTTEALNNEGSLWDKAYDSLQKEEPDRVAEYEDLLSRVLIRGKFSLQPGWLP